MSRSYPPKTCMCGERLWSFRAKLRHQRTCSKPVYERAEKVRRDAAAASMEPEPWDR